MAGEQTTTAAPAAETATPVAAAPVAAPAAVATPAAAAPVTAAPVALGGAPAATEAAKPVEPKPADVKPATAAEAAKPLELKVPQGFQADDPLLATFKDIATKQKLSSEQAQSVLDAYAADVEKIVASEKQRVAEEQKSWVDAQRADPDIGGKNYDANIKIANAALHRFGGPDLAKYLESTGLGNHPLIVKAFVRIARATAEDSSAGLNGAAPGGTANSLQAELDARYPSMKSINQA